MSSSHRPPLLALAALMAIGSIAGCGFEETQCLAADGTNVSKDEARPRRHHCGWLCNRACAFAGVPDEMHGCADIDDNHVCVLLPGWRCAPGYHDTVPESPGCECYGPSPDDCRPCADDELPHTGVDEDCDLRIDEDRTSDRRWSKPPNGPAGAIAEAPDLRSTGAEAFGQPSRALCTDDLRACGLPPGAADVRCARTEDGEGCIPVGERTAAMGRGEADCTDGIDDDGNGVIDDGPGCQTLVAAVAAPECHGRTPGKRCPPTYVPLDPSLPRLWSSEKPIVGVMTYDVLLDDTEATLGQVQRFLRTTGRCDNRAGANHPLCETTEPPDLPAGGLDWCVAYEYCQWAGKRLPTEMEWLHAFGGADGAPSTGLSCSEGGQTPECGARGPRTVGQPGGHSTRGVGAESTLWDPLGNVAEWLFDARLEPCEYPWVDCGDGPPRARVLPYDPAPAAPRSHPAVPRLLRGGGWAGELGAASVERRQFADPGVEVPHYGVRCAQTFNPTGMSGFGWRPFEEVPYEWTAPARAHAACVPLRRPERLAPRTPPHRLGQATDACVRGVDDRALDGFVWRITRSSERLLMSVTDEGGGAATMALEVGLVPGAEAFWLQGRPPSLTLVEEHCTPLGCAFERSSPGRLSIPDLGGGDVRLELHGVTPISGAIPTCLPPPPWGEAAWRLDTVLPRAGVRRAFSDGDGADRACEVLRCVDGRLDGSPTCAEKCPGWRLPIDVQTQQLTVP